MANPAPFTVPHFRAWARELYLDSGDAWELEPFQAAFLRDLFAGFLECWLVIPEGNAKTTLAGGTAIYYAQHQREASVTVAAAARDQAMWLYESAAGFVRRSPSIRSLFRLQEGYRRIRCDSMGSRIQIFAADDRTGDGGRPTLAILEELHRHRDLRLYRTWRGKIEKRGGRIVAISTAGEPEGEFETVRRAMRQTGKITRRGAHTRAATAETVLHDYAVPEDRSLDDMRAVKMANPLRAITIDQLRRKHDSPSMTPTHWKRFVGGQPAGLDEQPISPSEWDRLAVDIGGLEEGETVILVPSVGHNAAIAIAAHRPDEKVAVGAVLLEAGEDSPPYVRTEEAILELCEIYDVEGVYHPLGGFVRSAELLELRGVPMIEQPHSPTAVAAASGTFNRLLRSGGILHSGDEDLRAQVLGATLKTTETGERYEITNHSRALVPLCMAVHAITAWEPEPLVLAGGIA